MEELKDKFVYFSILKDSTIIFNDKQENTAEFVLPRHPETNDLDVYYLQSMLKYFDPTQEVLENEILDAFPVISLTENKQDKFYKLSLYRLRQFYEGQVEEDEYIQSSMKHLFMYSLLANPDNKALKPVIVGCLDKVSAVMYQRDERDTVDCDSYQLHRLVSYVPTATFRIMKLLRGWIEGALHFYDYSIMFFDYRFVGFDDFNENIIDLKTEDLFIHVYTDPCTRKVTLNIKEDLTKINESELHYEVELVMYRNRRQGLFTSPNNDNERDGKVMMFRNNDLKTRLEDILTFLFRKDNFHLNEVFKWNRYINGGKFDSHYDTMFVKKTSEECSLYTLLVYIEVKGDTFMYLYGEKEVQVRIESNKGYIIPHWVRHRVEGEGAREFIKTEIVFKNKYVGTSYDDTLADAFDASCYYMLQSVRHPELKDVVSQNFNTINEARFYKATYVPKLINKIFFLKTILKIPFEYFSSVDGNLKRTVDLKFNFITDGMYYYFKTKYNNKGNKPVVSFNEAIIMLSIMQLDIQPKKLFQRNVVECESVDYKYSISDFDINEEIVYWESDAFDRKIADKLQCTQYPSDVDKVHRVGNISVSDIRDNPDTFYFAACYYEFPRKEYNETLITKLTSTECNGNYSNLDVDFIGKQKNIIKIRQHSFKNGITVSRKWVTDKGKSSPIFR